MASKLKQIGKLIMELREDRNTTQEDLAKRLGTTQSAIARIENGEQNLSTEMLSKISEALNKEIVSLSSGALNLKIEGGRKLHGTITTRTSKNSAVGLLCASLLNKNEKTKKSKRIFTRMQRLYHANFLISCEVFCFNIFLSYSSCN